MSLPFGTIKQEILAKNERLWLDEAERRQAEVRSGRVTLVPGDQVLERLNKALGWGCSMNGA
jgi:hypothetical protein